MILDSSEMRLTLSSGFVEAAVSSAQVAFLFWVLVWIIDIAIDLGFSRHVDSSLKLNVI